MEENKGMEIMYRVAEMLSELEGEDFLIKDLKFDIIEEPKNEYNIKIEVPDNYYKKYDLQKPLSIKVDREVYNDYLNNKRNCFVKMVGGKKANIGFLFGFYRENGDVSDAIKVQIIETMRECFDINNENDVKNIISKKLNVSLEEIYNSIEENRRKKKIDAYINLDEHENFTDYGLGLGFLFANSILLGLMEDSLYSIIKFDTEIYKKDKKYYIKIISNDASLSNIKDIEANIEGLNLIEDLDSEDLFSFCIRYNSNGTCTNNLITSSLMDILLNDSLKKNIVSLMYSLYKIESREDLDDLIEYIKYKLDETENDPEEIFSEFGLTDDKLEKILNNEKYYNDNESTIDIEPTDELSIDEMNDIIDDILND